MNADLKEWEEKQKIIDTEYADIDLTKSPPIDEAQRQRYFIKKCREIVKKKTYEIGRPLFACLITFGCEMNAERVTA